MLEKKKNGIYLQLNKETYFIHPNHTTVVLQFTRHSNTQQERDN